MRLCIDPTVSSECVKHLSAPLANRRDAGGVRERPSSSARQSVGCPHRRVTRAGLWCRRPRPDVRQGGGDRPVAVLNAGGREAKRTGVPALTEPRTH